MYSGLDRHGKISEGRARLVPGSGVILGNEHFLQLFLLWFLEELFVLIFIVI